MVHTYKGKLPHMNEPPLTHTPSPLHSGPPTGAMALCKEKSHLSWKQVLALQGCVGECGGQSATNNGPSHQELAECGAGSREWLMGEGG